MCHFKRSMLCVYHAIKQCQLNFILLSSLSLYKEQINKPLFWLILYQTGYFMPMSYKKGQACSILKWSPYPCIILCGSFYHCVIPEGSVYATSSSFQAMHEGNALLLSALADSVVTISLAQAETDN